MEQEKDIVEEIKPEQPTDQEASETQEKAPDKKEKKAADKEAKKLRAEVEKLEKQLEKAKADMAAAEDKYLRLAAEYDNFRKRSTKEREAIYGDAAADCIKELLPVIDNLQRATEYTAPDKVAEGIEMILGSLPAVFEKMKITPFGKPGDTFDPNLHNAVMHVEDEEHRENEIVEVFQQGYSIGDRIVRYAMVKVAN